MASMLKRAFRGERVHAADVPLRTKRGAGVLLQMSASPIDGDGPMTGGVVLIGVEVTSARALEEQKLAAARLRASRESKQELPRARLTPPLHPRPNSNPSPRRARAPQDPLPPKAPRPKTRRPSLHPPPLSAVRRTSWRRSRMSSARRSTGCSARCSSRCSGRSRTSCSCHSRTPRTRPRT